MMEKEEAEIIFNDFAEKWDIDTCMDDLQEDEIKSFNDLKRKFIRAVKEGILVFNDEDGTLKQNLRYSTASSGAKELTYSRPKGDAYMGMDKYKEKEGQKKVFSFLASMTKQPIQIFSAMDSIDIKISQTIFTLFFAS